MLLQKLSHNIVLLLKLCFELLDFLVFGVFLAFDIMAVWLAFKDSGSFVKELFLPLVVLDGMDFVLVDQCRYRDSIDQMLPYNRDLLRRRSKRTFGHSGTSL